MFPFAVAVELELGFSLDVEFGFDLLAGTARRETPPIPRDEASYEIESKALFDGASTDWLFVSQPGRTLLSRSGLTGAEYDLDGSSGFVGGLWVVGREKSSSFQEWSERTRGSRG